MEQGLSLILSPAIRPLSLAGLTALASVGEDALSSAADLISQGLASTGVEPLIHLREWERKVGGRFERVKIRGKEGVGTATGL